MLTDAQVDEVRQDPAACAGQLLIKWFAELLRDRDGRVGPDRKRESERKEAT
jgi:hypothetical protein